MTSCRRLSFVRRQQVVLGGLVKRMDEPSQESNMSEQGNVLILSRCPTTERTGQAKVQTLKERRSTA